MSNSSHSAMAIGTLAIATGAAGLLGLFFLVLFFVAGEPFGTINDACIAVTAVLGAVLAWILYSGSADGRSAGGMAAVILACIGAIIVVIGAVLVISHAAGWFLAGLYMAAGNALIGLWLLFLNASGGRLGIVPHGLMILGIAAGLIMALGLAAIPGIRARSDSWESAAWFVSYLGQAGALGYLMLFPIWCILFGRSMLVK